MLSVIKQLTQGTILGIFDTVFKTIDELHTSDEEKLQMKHKLLQAQNEKLLQLEQDSLKYEAEITKRWVSDNEHAITRLVRPGVVIWVVVMFTGVMIADGNIGGFNIKEAYIPLLETLLVTVIIAYFGSRGTEKAMKIFKRGSADA